MTVASSVISSFVDPLQDYINEGSSSIAEAVQGPLTVAAGLPEELDLITVSAVVCTSAAVSMVLITAGTGSWQPPAQASQAARRANRPGARSRT